MQLAQGDGTTAIGGDANATGQDATATGHGQQQANDTCRSEIVQQHMVQELQHILMTLPLVTMQLQMRMQVRSLERMLW